MTESATDQMSGRLALGRYRVVKELARGGMGMVYLGRVEGAAGFSKPVVIKRVLSHVDESKGARDQFIREARLLSELQHPNIVGVVDFGEEQDGYLMILEYVHGFHVGMWLRYVLSQGRQFHWEFALLIVNRVLLALHYAHTRIGQDGKKRPIIHRDVSPGNVLIDLQGNVRLLDFGIARTADDEEARTQNGIVKGKLPFIAPEIYRSADASVVSDVYSTGVMLYQLLSGKNPFSAKDMSTIIGRVLDYTPPPISTLRSDLPKELDAVLMRALEKDPKRRYPSAQEFGNALSALFTCSDSEVAEEMHSAVVIEFSEEMAHTLGIPSLSVLDAAWRASSEDPNQAESLQRSSCPPADRTQTAVTQAMPQDGKLPQTVHDTETVITPVTASAHAERMRRMPNLPGPMSAQDITLLSGVETVVVDLNTGNTATAAFTPMGGTPLQHIDQSSRTMVGIVVAGVLVAGALLGAAYLWRGGDAKIQDSPQRYLLVERPSNRVALTNEQQAKAATVGQSQVDVAPAKDATHLEQPTSEPASDPLVKQLGGSKRAPAQLTDAQKVTVAFGTRQAAVQSCFGRAASGISGTPELSLHFKIAGDGSVQSASLSPSSVAGSSLGSCLIAVARTTKFPAVGKSLSFAIPITAQVVKP